MELTEKQRGLLKLLNERGRSTLLTGRECLSARTLKLRGLVIYDGCNHYAITDAGRKALEGRE